MPWEALWQVRFPRRGFAGRAMPRSSAQQSLQLQQPVLALSGSGLARLAPSQSRLGYAQKSSALPRPKPRLPTSRLLRALGQRRWSVVCGAPKVSASAPCLLGLWSTSAASLRQQAFGTARQFPIAAVQPLPPNRSFNRTRHGMAPGPRGALCLSSAARARHHAASRRLTLR